MKLDVNKNEFLVQSPKYLLPLPLAECVDSDKVAAAQPTPLPLPPATNLNPKT